MRLLLSAGLVLLCLTGVMAQSVPETCGNVPMDVTFTPSNCLEAGGEATLETPRFRGVAIVNLFIAGANGRIGGGDRGVRVNGDGVLRLRIDTTDFFGAQIPAGDYSVIIKDVTGRITPIIVPFTVTGASAPVVPTESATTTPELPDTTPTVSRTSVTDTTPTATVRGTPTRTPTATVVSTDSASLCRQTPNPGEAFNFPIAIFDIDQEREIVTLENVSDELVDLDGWTMCSLTGDQVHTGISGPIEALETLEFEYDGATQIWNDAEQDDGALYDADGNLISYFENIE